VRREKSAPCPRCGAPAILETSNPWRPFCSERCKLIDLGNWASGRYVIPAEELDSGTEKDEDQ
jgi:endogenous inhibitor of DNA gyrase (YacG/DUF329 family)